jgi:hypothetical protein
MDHPVHMSVRPTSLTLGMDLQVTILDQPASIGHT